MPQEEVQHRDVANAHLLLFRVKNAAMILPERSVAAP